jgi:hypothetical protein
MPQYSYGRRVAVPRILSESERRGFEKRFPGASRIRVIGQHHERGAAPGGAAARAGRKVSLVEAAGALA